MLTTIALVVTLLFPFSLRAEQWTLEAAVQQALEVSPELRAASAAVAVREGALTQARAWTNPSVELRADNALAIEQGQGGAELTQFALSQPLPILRLPYARAAAEADLAAARDEARHQRLRIEHRAARAFHAIQLASDNRALAEDRLRLTEATLARQKPGDPLKRYLTPLERQRLAILREEAHQALKLAEREYDEQFIAFQALLALDGRAVQVQPLALPSAPPPLDVLTAHSAAEHPAVSAARHGVEMARANIAVARTTRFADPAVTLFRERDVLNGRPQSVTGIGLQVQIPLWHANRGPLVQARAQADRAQAQLAALTRDVETALTQAHAKLHGTLNQAQRHRARLLEPATEVYGLTRKSFAVGEVNVLTLIDANNTYYDARARYLELLAQAWFAAAELRLATGRSLFSASIAP